MEFKNTLEIVTKDIQEIENLVSNFKNYSRIPNIELDLALSRLRNVYDLLLLFRDDSNSEKQTPAHKSSKGEIEPDRGVSAVDPSDTGILATDSTIEIETPATTGPSYGPVKDPMATSKEKIANVPVDPHQHGIRSKTEGQKTYIHENPVDPVNKKDSSSRPQNQTVKSISGSLGINDKFFYIRELFAGNAENFRQTMEELDDAHNFNDAYSLLMSKFQWDMDSEPVQMLLNLVRRKFIPSGNE